VDDTTGPDCFDRISHGTTGCSGGTICCESKRACCGTNTCCGNQYDKRCIPGECDMTVQPIQQPVDMKTAIQTKNHHGVALEVFH